MSSSTSVPSTHSRSNTGDEAKDIEPLDKKPRLSQFSSSSLLSYSQSLGDEVDHASLNEEVIRNVGDTPTIIDILMETIFTCESLNEELARPKELRALAKEPELEALVKDAWLKKDFTQIRRLAIFQKNPGSNIWGGRTKHEVHSLESSARDRQLAVTKSAWTTPYIGQSHMSLLESIHGMNSGRKDKVYDNNFAIVQSSGTGKSRMVHEMAKHVFTIPFNIRSDVETSCGAFPDPDDSIRNHLVLHQNHTSEGAKIHYMKFLLGLFSKVFEELRKVPEPSPTDPNNTFARAWFNHLGKDGVRSALYTNVVAECEKTGALSSVADSMDVDSESGSAVLGTVTQPSEETATGFQAISECAKNKLAALISLVSSKAGMQQSDESVLKPAQIIIYIDEAHALINVAVQGGEGPRVRTLYTEFTSVVNEFRNYPIVFVFLSTKNSNFSRLAPPVRLYPSARVFEARAALQPLFTELPFDCGDEPFISPNPADDNAKTFAEVADIKFMAQFGRPLWSSLLANGMLESDLIHLARAKLTARSDPDAKVADPTLSLAVFAVRLLFDFNLSRVITQSATVRLVESHMAIVFSVPKHREVLRIGYPSEPILAEAAAQQMHSFRMHHLQESRCLLDLVNDGYIDIGERGELVARFLVTQAYDRAVEAYQTEKEGFKSLEDNHPFYSEGVPLTYFIKALFTDRYATLILKSKPDNVHDGQAFEVAFEKVWVRCLTFQRAANTSIINSLAACGAASRGMAFQCCNNQRCVDQVLPVIFRRQESGKEVCLSERDTSFIGIQNRTREYPGSEAATAFSEKDIKFFPENTETPRPYSTLVMNLGGTTESKGSTVIAGMIGEFAGKQKTVGVVHPRYPIFAYGCSKDVYNGVDSDDEKIFAQILDKVDLLSEHPRQTENALSALQRLKPSWKEGEDYWHWLRSDILWESQA